MKFKEYLKRGLCLSFAAALLLTGCSNGSTPASNNDNVSDEVADTNTTNETEKPKDEDNAVQIAASDVELAEALQDKYGASPADYEDDILEVERAENIEFQLGFNPFEADIDSWGEYFTVYQDAEMQYPIDCFVECDYDNKTISIEPVSGIAQLTTASGSDIDLSDLTGDFLLYDHDDRDAYLDNYEVGNELSNPGWGNFERLYLVQKLDIQTGKELETPHITIVEVGTELKEAPVAQYSCDENGVATISWTPVEGATEYVLFYLTKFVDGDGFNSYATAFARTSDTTWIAPTYESEYDGSVLNMNTVFSNYITSEDNIAGGIEDMNSDYFETMVDHIGVIAITSTGSSPVSNLCSLKTYAQLLPESWAWNQNNEEVGSSFCQSVDLLPAEVNVTMCDGTTSKRVIEYDFDNYVLNEDNTRIEIPSRASGTLLNETYTAVVQNPETLEADLAAIQERQEKLRSKGGAVDKGVDVKDDRNEATDGESQQLPETTDGDAEVTEAPEATEPEETEAPEATEPQETATPESATTPATSELNTDIKVTANSALSEYIAIQMLNSREVIDLNLFSESRNRDIVIDAYMEAKYQNPLVMGINGVAYDDDSRLLYVQYDDEPAATAQKREEVQKKAKEIVGQIITPDMSSLEKEMAINQYLCENAVYDDAALESAEKYDFKDVDDAFNDSFTPYGVLVNGVGVCASYAGAFKVLADEAGLECIVVAGFLEGNLSHAWNRVKIDDQWLTVDSTNNDNELLQNALLNISDTGASGTLVEDDRFMIDEKLNDYKGDTDANEFYRVNGKYFDTNAIVDQLVEELNADGEATLRTDYTIDDEQFQTIAQSVVNKLGGNIKGYYWLGVIYLTTQN